MKHLFLFIVAITICLFAKAQITEGGIGNPLHYEDVVKTDTLLKKSVLYSKSLEWFIKTFANGKSVIQLQDPEAGVVIGNFNFSCDVSYNDYIGIEGQLVHASIKISVKDGRIKYELYDFFNGSYGPIKDGDYIAKGLGKGIRTKRYKQYQKDSQNEASLIQASIINYFTKQVPKSDNW